MAIAPRNGPQIPIKTLKDVALLMGKFLDHVESHLDAISPPDFVQDIRIVSAAIGRETKSYRATQKFAQRGNCEDHSE